MNCIYPMREDLFAFMLDLYDAVAILLHDFLPSRKLAQPYRAGKTRNKSIRADIKFAKPGTYCIDDIAPYAQRPTYPCDVTNSCVFR